MSSAVSKAQPSQQHWALHHNTIYDKKQFDITSPFSTQISDHGTKQLQDRLLKTTIIPGHPRSSRTSSARPLRLRLRLSSPPLQHPSSHHHNTPTLNIISQPEHPTHHFPLPHSHSTDTSSRSQAPPRIKRQQQHITRHSTTSLPNSFLS